MRSPIARLALLLLAGIALSTCALPPETASTPQAAAQLIADNVAVMDGTITVMRFRPPPIYTMWRAEMEECSGLSREGSPTFWIASTVFLTKPGRLGAYVSPHRRIIFGLGNETLAWVVRHELLHDLINPAPGDTTHAPEFFEQKCGALVHPERTP